MSLILKMWMTSVISATDEILSSMMKTRMMVGCDFSTSLKPNFAFILFLHWSSVFRHIAEMINFCFLRFHLYRYFLAL